MVVILAFKVVVFIYMVVMHILMHLGKVTWF